MAPKKNAQILPADCLPSCGACESFERKEADGSVGWCQLNPRQIVVSENGILSMYPEQDAGDRCRSFLRKVN